MPKISFTDPTTIKSQRAYSDALRQTADAPLEGTMAGNVYVAPSWTQGLNKMVSSYLAGKSSREADAAEKANSEAKRNAISELLRLPEGQRMQALGNYPSLVGMSEPVLAAQLAQSLEPKKRVVVKGADGYNYYQDDGSRVLPGVTKPENMNNLILSDGTINQKLMDAKGQIAERGRSNVEVNNNLGGEKLTPGQKKADEAYAADFVEFKAGGGYADSGKMITQLRDARKMLASGRDDITGPAVGKIPNAVKSFTHPEAIATKEAIEEVVQRNLRLILGAQFTEKEGERLIARAYNENLQEPENLKRLDRLIKQIESAYKTKIDAVNYFDENGTLRGWNGKIPNLSDFYEELDKPDSAATPKPPPKAGHIEDGYRFIGGDPSDQNNWEPVDG